MLERLGIVLRFLNPTTQISLFFGTPVVFAKQFNLYSCLRLQENKVPRQRAIPSLPTGKKQMLVRTDPQKEPNIWRVEENRRKQSRIR